MIVKKLLDPSRPDAVRLKRNEKLSMLHMMYAVTVIDDLKTDICDRIEMIQDGMERLDRIAKESDALLNELRVTIPENQRIAMQHTAEDYEIRLTPKATPSENNVIITKEEFRELVDAAKTKCMDCTLDDEECSKCKLYQLFTSVVPLDNYNALNLCPYNLGGWAN